MIPNQDNLAERSTPELVRLAVDDLKRFVEAEVSHARRELKDEVQAAKRAGIWLGVASVLGLCGLSSLVVALGISLPGDDALGVLGVAVFLLILAGVAFQLGKRTVPRKPLERTRARLSSDWTTTRERMA